MRTTRTGSTRAIVVFAIAFVAVGAHADHALAQTTDATSEDQIVLTGRLVVESGETVHDAVIFDGDARVDGTVDESLVVFNGDAVVTGTVARDVVVLNGDIRIASGAAVGGDLISQGAADVETGATVRGEQRRIGAFDVGDVGFASRIAWWVGYSASTLALGLLLLLFAPAIDAALTRVVRTRRGASFGAGVGVFLLTPVLAAVLFVTIVGIPLGLFLFLALAFLYTVGYVIGAHAVGRFVVKAPSRFIAFLAGWAILRAVALIPIAGGIVWVLATILGLGAAIVAARSGRAVATAQPAAGVPPMPPAPLSPGARP